MEADYDYQEQGDGSWRSKAMCRGRGNDDFFIEGAGCSSRYLTAKILCFNCPVQQECLSFAINNGIKDGVWGGFAYRDRLAIRSGRRSAEVTLHDVMKGNFKITNQAIDKIAEVVGVTPDEIRTKIRKDRRRNNKRTRNRMVRQEKEQSIDN